MILEYLRPLPDGVPDPIPVKIHEQGHAARRWDVDEPSLDDISGTGR